MNCSPCYRICYLQHSGMHTTKRWPLIAGSVVVARDPPEAFAGDEAAFGAPLYRPSTWSSASPVKKFLNRPEASAV